MFELEMMRTQLTAGAQALQAADPAALSREQLLELLDALEVEARQRSAVGYALVAELAARGVAAELGCPSTEVLLSEGLRIGRREATARVRLAEAVGPRRALTGERLAPRFPQVEAALADGVISARHAAVITATVDRLSDRVVDEHPGLAAQRIPPPRTRKTRLGRAHPRRHPEMDPTPLAGSATSTPPQHHPPHPAAV